VVPRLVAADVCRALGFDIDRGAGKHLRSLRADERRNTPILDGGRGNPNTAVVSGSGLYRLVLRSDKPDEQAGQTLRNKIGLPGLIDTRERGCRR
jgi:prophage antirepressor-like protein